MLTIENLSLNQKKIMIKKQLIIIGGAITFMAFTASCSNSTDDLLPESGVESGIKSGINTKKTLAVSTLVIPGLPNTLMKSGFGTGVSVSNPVGSQTGSISGGDISPYSWTNITTSTTYFDRSRFNYEQGTISQRGADIQNDPILGTSNKVLRFFLNEFNITLPSGEKKGRVAYEIDNVNHQGTKVKEYSQKVRMLLSSDFSLLANSTLPAPGKWLTLFEFGDDIENGLSIPTASRISVNVVRKTNYSVGDAKLYLEAQFQEHNPGWQDASWGRVKNTTVALPIAQWFTVEIYIKQGIGNNGRFLMTLNGNTVFDQTGTNVSSLFAAQGTQPDGQESWNPMKMYCEKSVIDLFKNASGGAKPMKIYWDDIEIKYNP